MNIQGTTALVTGANGGLGAAIARGLAREGAALVLTGRRAEALSPIASELGARTIIADLSRREDVARCMREAGPIDVLVCNAGIPSNGSLLEMSPQHLDDVLDVMLRAPIHMAREAALAMASRGRGQIDFISSVSGLVASPGTTLYSASKFGLRGFALALREDLREAGVGVTVVYPGFIRDAGMFADTGVQLPFGAGTRSPEDVARAVVRAVRQSPAEIVVAAPDQSLGAFLGNLSHRTTAMLQRWLGAEKVARALSEAQAHKRRT